MMSRFLTALSNLRSNRYANFTLDCWELYVEICRTNKTQGMDSHNYVDVLLACWEN
jgi:hypothetical protein